LQSELRRVGCNAGAVDGNWNAASRRALDLFNKHAGMKLDVKMAGTDALDAVKGQTGRIYGCRLGPNRPVAQASNGVIVICGLVLRTSAGQRILQLSFNLLGQFH
jgi:hypothetical protein